MSIKGVVWSFGVSLAMWAGIVWLVLSSESPVASALLTVAIIAGIGAAAVSSRQVDPEERVSPETLRRLRRVK